MRVKIVFILYILILTLSGCSSKYGIRKTYAFSRQITAGNIPVDHNNSPTTSGVQKAHLVYIETKADEKKPTWDTAWVEGVAYGIEPIRIVQDVISLGKTKDESTNVEIKATNGNVLWQLLLKPLAATATFNTIIDKTGEHPIVLRGVWNNKQVQFIIKEEIELATTFSE